MKGLLWVLALFALAVGISLAVNINDGYVLLVLPPYRAEISLNLAILLALLGFMVIYALLRTAALTLSLPRRVREFQGRREHKKSLEYFGEGVRLLFEGRFTQAMKKAGDAHVAGRIGAPAALLAARAAQQLGEHERLKTWLDLAIQDDPKAQPACLMLEAEMLVEMSRFAEAVDLLSRLQASSGTHVAALRLEMRAQRGCGKWNEVLRIARQLEKHHILPPDQTSEIKSEAHGENLLSLRSSRADLLGYLKRLPAGEHAPVLDQRIAETLLELGEHDEAAAFIRKRLEKAWDSRLAGLYGQVRGGDVTRRMAQSDTWLQEHRDDAQLLLALGRMCIEQRLWGKAQTYLDAALSVADSAADEREIRLELARLPEESRRHEDVTVQSQVSS